MNLLVVKQEPLHNFWRSYINTKNHIFFYRYYYFNFTLIMPPLVVHSYKQFITKYEIFYVPNRGSNPGHLPSGPWSNRTVNGILEAIYSQE